jgi:hypothetical protein
MNIKRIEAPMFTIAGEQYNEYEIRQLQIDVAKGLPFDSVITDNLGNTTTINNEGRLVNHLNGYNLTHDLSIELYFVHHPKE